MSDLSKVQIARASLDHLVSRYKGETGFTGADIAKLSAAVQNIRAVIDDAEAKGNKTSRKAKP